MSYLVLARKSRPQTFDQVIGQQPVVKTLRNSLSRNRVAHAILFSGVRGVGKTTLARIMAKAINCTSTDINIPCNTCLSCKEITAGSALDLYEIDGASNRGIQEIRDLKEKIRFLPTSSKYRIIIIDEVHMLTTEAFNALLKTLEEPPEHVYFMFATTELHKIPITILSRCQQYELKRVSAEELNAHFKKLVESEEKTIASQALSLIVREAAGSVRDGLSLLDQALSFSNDHITTEDVVEVLGLIDRDVLIALTQALLDGNHANAFLSLDQIFKFGMDIKRFCTDLIGQFRSLLLCKIDGCQPLVDLPDAEYQLYTAMAKQYSTESLHLKMNMLVDMAEHIGRSNQPRLIFETTFLKIIEAGNIVPVTALLGKLESFLKDGMPSTLASQQNSITPSVVEAPEAKKKDLQEQPKARTTRHDETETVVSTKTLSRTAAAPTRSYTADIQFAAMDDEDIKASSPHPSNGPSPEPTAIEDTTHTVLETAEPQPTQPKTDQTTSNKKDISNDWEEFLAYLQQESTWMAQSLSHVDKVEHKANSLVLHYDDSVNCALLRRPEHIAELKKIIFAFFNKDIIVDFILPDDASENHSSSAGTIQTARHELLNHPLVIAATEVFRGHVSDVRITSKK